VSDAGCENIVLASVGRYRRSCGGEQLSLPDRDEFLRIVGEAVQDYERRNQKANSLGDCQVDVGDGRVSLHQLPLLVQEWIREGSAAAIEAHKSALEKKAWEDSLREILNEIEFIGDQGPLLTWQRVPKASICSGFVASGRKWQLHKRLLASSFGCSGVRRRSRARSQASGFACLESHYMRFATKGRARSAAPKDGVGRRPARRRLEFDRFGPNVVELERWGGR
jgi:hypothetical protein